MSAKVGILDTFLKKKEYTVVRDFKVDRFASIFQLSDDDVESIWKVFLKIDVARSGYAETNVLFQYFDLDRNVLTDRLLELIETKSSTNITFGEFFTLICTVCCFEQSEMLKYVFFVLDKDKTGYIDITETKHVVMNIWNDEYTSNIEQSFEYIQQLDMGDGRISYKDFLIVHRKYPNTFYPLFEIQVQMQRKTLGEAWWSNKKTLLKEAVEEKEAAEKNKRAAAELAAQKANDGANESLVRKRMGIKYYLMPWARAQERIKAQKIAAITSNL